MKYICFGYYDKGKFEGMTAAEQNAMFDTCFDYDDHLGSRQIEMWRRWFGTGSGARCHQDVIQQRRKALHLPEKKTG